MTRLARLNTWILLEIYKSRNYKLEISITRTECENSDKENQKYKCRFCSKILDRFMR